MGNPIHYSCSQGRLRNLTVECSFLCYEDPLSRSVLNSDVEIILEVDILNLYNISICFYCNFVITLVYNKKFYPKNHLLFIFSFNPLIAKNDRQLFLFHQVLKKSYIAKVIAIQCRYYCLFKLIFNS